MGDGHATLGDDLAARGHGGPREVEVRFRKYHALGNDYLVLEPGAVAVTAGLARRVCDRRRGVGADGVLVGTAAVASGFGLRIVNPDGSEAETSGNGLRIFARSLYDAGRVGDAPFRVRTAGGAVTCQLLDAGRLVRVAMGRASFDARRVPVLGASGEVVDAPLGAAYPEGWRYSAVSMGNPHAVVIVPEATPALARRWGPVIEHDARFPRRTNVQFVTVMTPARLRLEVWERGAGYTEASGSSACAAAAASRRLGLCGAEVVVAMPGGALQVRVDEAFAVTHTGPVAFVAAGELAPELVGGDA
jgi:diaminopimelate epimerase